MSEPIHQAEAVPPPAPADPAPHAPGPSLLKRARGVVVAVAAVGAVASGLTGYWNAWRVMKPSVAPEAVAAIAASAAPASAADRRMTFAVLPFSSPREDAAAERLATTAHDAAQTMQEARGLWAWTSPGALVAQAAKKPLPLREIARALDVHFLVRGNIVPGSAGPALELAVIDGANEQVIASRSLKALAGDPPVIPPADVDDALARLTYAALRVEVARVRARPESELDVRDLAWRAFVEIGDHGQDAPAATYEKAERWLERARTLAPDDVLTLRITAQINLCECLQSWAPDTEPMERIGTAALERVLTLQPDSAGMLMLRAFLFVRKGRYEDALAVTDHVLKLEPDDEQALGVRVQSLARLDRFAEAAQALPLLAKRDDSSAQTIAAMVDFDLGRDDAASRAARRAATALSGAQKSTPDEGTAPLILAAAEARLGHADRARAALADFQQAVPGVRTVAQLKGWLRPHSPVPDTAAFYDALRRAGMPA